MIERIYQVEKKEGSTGLGLAIIKAIATNYNLKLNYHHNNGMHTFSIEN